MQILNAPKASFLSKQFTKIVNDRGFAPDRTSPELTAIVWGKEREFSSNLNCLADMIDF